MTEFLFQKLTNQDFLPLFAESQFQQYNNSIYFENEN